MTHAFHGSDTNKFAVSSSLFDDEILDYAYVQNADGAGQLTRQRTRACTSLVCLRI